MYIKACIQENDLLGQLTAWLEDTKRGARTVSFIVADKTFVIQRSLPFHLAKTPGFLLESCQIVIPTSSLAPGMSPLTELRQSR